MSYQNPVENLVRVKLTSGEEFTGYILEQFPNGIWFRRKGYVSWFGNEIIQEVKR